MNIYIKGMEMPTSCEECPFLDYEEGFCFASRVKSKNGGYEFTLCPDGIKGGRADNCPLVPVPPHGRLIEETSAFEHVAEYVGGYVSLYLIKEGLQVAPTIIPAEEGKKL